jgi:hypothetical protein
VVKDWAYLPPKPERKIAAGVEAGGCKVEYYKNLFLLRFYY